MKNFYEIIKKLSSEIGPREVNSTANKRAEDFIYNYLSELKYDVSLQEIIIDNKSYGNNILACLPESQELQRIVLVGAHYDTVKLSHGACDNASGVAAMLEMAKRFVGVDTQSTRLIFAAFNAEELGSFGSQAYVNSLDDRERQLHYAAFTMDVFASESTESETRHDREHRETAIVCQTCGGRGEEAYVSGSETEAVENSVSRAFGSALRDRGLVDDLSPDSRIWALRSYAHSDHASFHNSQIDSANITIRGTRANKGRLSSTYHRPEDTYDSLDFELCPLALDLLYDSISKAVFLHE